MANKVTIVLLSALSVSLVGAQYSNHYCIDSSAADSIACRQTRPDVQCCCCKSLSYLLTNGSLPNSSEIRIFKAVQLNETLSIANLQDIALVGNASSKIICSHGMRSGAGLVFANIINLTIANLSFSNCGTLQNGTSFNSHTENKTLMFRSTLYILNTTNMIIRNVEVSSTNGIGVAIFDTIGQVTISYSNFTNNSVIQSSKPEPGGGGLYIEFTYCTPGIYDNCQPTNTATDTHYSLKNCAFFNNSATTPYPNETSFVFPSKSHFDGFGRGGGLNFMVKGFATRNTVNITGCTFQNNAAIWGGGLYIVFLDSPSFHTFYIQNCHFIENKANLNGGGGANIGYLLARDANSTENNINFKSCLFQKNTAQKYGGGTAYFSTRGDHQNITKNQVEFRNCRWIENTAISGSAVDVAPEAWYTYGNGLLPTPRFYDNTFHLNKILNQSTTLGDGVTKHQKGVGAFIISNTNVIFGGYTIFSHNSGTAIYLTSAILAITENAQINFLCNTGKYGGAIALYGYSVIYVEQNTIMNFTANRASIQGGALYQFSYDKHEYFASRSCFIQYKDKMPVPQERNITLYFKDNSTPNGDGDAIFATSIIPCTYGCSSNDSKSPTFSQAFQCIGTLYGQDSIKKGNNVSTIARNFKYVKTNLKAIIPGMEFKLPLLSFDEMNRSKQITYKVSADNDIKLDGSSKQVMTNGTMRLHGKGGDTGLLLLQYADTSVSLDIGIAECPPGYTLENDSQNLQSCICAAEKFLGILRCTENKYQALIQRGIWIGQCRNEQICTGNCPLGFCTYNDSKTTDIVYALPLNPLQLDDFICGSKRKGILCGQCRENHSTYYHSYMFKCDSEDICHIGILLYIFAELVPLTIVFIIIMVLNINFTSGSATGFILFAQIIDSLAVTANGAIQFTKPIALLTTLHRFIYRFFSLDFFSIEEFSFCLWKGATVLDAMALKYVTICYALILVLCTVFIMRTGKCLRFCSWLRPLTLKSAVIHGLTAFFVMCYSQCARVSIQILYPTYLYGENFTHIDTVLFRSGHNHLFDAEHLKYAIPALFFLVTIVIAPPLLLLLYPLSYKVLGLCKLSETRMFARISRLIPIQLLDSFQGCFHDNLRFFAGLYFFYRTMTLAIYAIARTLVQFYTIVEIQLIVILAVHAAVQPYKKRWHNAVESLIFADLAIINGITLYNYATAEGVSSISTTMSAVQVILIYLPLVYIIAYIAGNILTKTKAKCKKKWSNDAHMILEDSSELPPLREQNENINLARDMQQTYSAF